MEHGVTEVDFLPLLLSWTECHDNTPKLLAFIHFMNLVVDYVPFIHIIIHDPTIQKILIIILIIISSKFTFGEDPFESFWNGKEFHYESSSSVFFFDPDTQVRLDRNGQ